LSAVYQAANPIREAKNGSSQRVKDHRGFTGQLRCCYPRGPRTRKQDIAWDHGLHVTEEKASVKNGKIDEYRVTMEVTFTLEG
jgi:hypothetical protein